MVHCKRLHKREGYIGAGGRHACPAGDPSAWGGAGGDGMSSVRSSLCPFKSGEMDENPWLRHETQLSNFSQVGELDLIQVNQIEFE